MKTKEFVNGFDSWSETHFEVTDFIVTIRNTSNIPNGIIKDIQESQGTAGLWELAVQWTDEFENLNKGRNWEDGDFYDEIEEFCKIKNKE